MQQIHLLGLPEPTREYKFSIHRNFRFDFAWPQFMLAVEIEGGTRGISRHTQPDGYERDTEKYNLAATNHWTVLRYTTQKVTSGHAITEIEQALMQAKEKKHAK